MLKIKIFMSVIVTMLILISGLALAQVASDQAAPNFTLTDTNGQKHSLSDYKGKFVVLEWFNPDCPFVKKHYNSGNMPNLQKQYTSKGLYGYPLILPPRANKAIIRRKGLINS